MSHKCQRGLVIIARCETKIDARFQSMLSDHATEQVVGDAPNKAGWNAEPRQSNGHIEARSADHRPCCVTSIPSRDRNKVDQRIATGEDHRTTSAVPGIETAHRFAAPAIKSAQEPINLAFPSMKFTQSRRTRSGQLAER